MSVSVYVRELLSTLELKQSPRIDEDDKTRSIRSLMLTWFQCAMPGGCGANLRLDSIIHDIRSIVVMCIVYHQATVW